jgi:hypothetical protein
LAVSLGLQQLVNPRLGPRPQQHLSPGEPDLPASLFGIAGCGLYFLIIVNGCIDFELDRSQLNNWVHGKDYSLAEPSSSRPGASLVLDKSLSWCLLKGLRRRTFRTQSWTLSQGPC